MNISTVISNLKNLLVDIDTLPIERFQDIWNELEIVYYGYIARIKKKFPS